MKEIIKKLQHESTRFTIDGIKNHKGENTIFKVHITKFSILIGVDEWFGNQMNVDKFGTMAVWLYSYDMFGKRSSSKISYKDITFIEE